MTSLSESKTGKIKRDGWKERILNIVFQNSSLNGSQLTKICTEKIELSDTLVKELIKELLKEKKLNYVETYNNQKHYWLPNKQNLSREVMFDRQLICGIGFLDERLNWMEKQYSAFTQDQKAGLVRNTTSLLYHHIHHILISQSLSDGKNRHDKAFTSYKKRIKKLLDIINSDSSSDKEIIMAWFEHLLWDYPHDYAQFLKDRETLLDKSNYV